MLILRLHVHDVIATMLEDDNKRFLISFSLIISSNMAARSLCSHSLGNDCNPRIFQPYNNSSCQTALFYQPMDLWLAYQ
jgi:hypothetical protein